MAASMTIATAVSSIGNLIPTYRSPNLVGDGAYVLTMPHTLPERLREAQEERTTYYMTHTWQEGDRTKPDHAPRYFVTSYDVLIAWVTLDGTVHYATLVPSGRTKTGALKDTPRDRAIYRHQQAVRAVWPERFPAVQE